MRAENWVPQFLCDKAGALGIQTPGTEDFISLSLCLLIREMGLLAVPLAERRLHREKKQSVVTQLKATLQEGGRVITTCTAQHGGISRT